ncbi:uncharacterized protein LOC122511711 [Leptopilina heterotoma]|uniref:uncharacterized protein LOC122511711 n=1 Tax=Leptopilina heterotoma TaxID=63436 RepID=UPI001CA84DCF|nr:uncharacterized protein LOC122511711 [Leptopilina heterotoma]XP_043483063.1 uncharacterized protein LOC122511711 [Leptopilina heterotoma]XP_043483064.1 uncharacterized protein LOC122511711 [Leptopilina heterotoma]
MIAVIAKVLLKEFKCMDDIYLNAAIYKQIGRDSSVKKKVDNTFKMRVRAIVNKNIIFRKTLEKLMLKKYESCQNFKYKWEKCSSEIASTVNCKCRRNKLKNTGREVKKFELLDGIKKHEKKNDELKNKKQYNTRSRKLVKEKENV